MNDLLLHISHLWSPQPLPPVPTDDTTPPPVPRKPNFPPSWPCKLTCQWPWPQKLLLPKDFKIASFSYGLQKHYEPINRIFFHTDVQFLFAWFTRHWLLGGADLLMDILKVRMTYACDLEQFPLFHPTEKEVISAWGFWSMQTSPNTCILFFLYFLFAVLHEVLWMLMDWNLNAFGSDRYFLINLCNVCLFLTWIKWCT